MSLIIAYMGKKGCVMAADKRKIAYFGDKEDLDALEDELYNGTIQTDDEFLQRADELNVSVKITDGASKLLEIGEIIRGEVSSKGTFQTKRRRIYGTTNGFQLVELLGSQTQSRKAGNNGIIIFGNKYAKQLAQKLISAKWKASQNLITMREVFEEILGEVSSKTPTVGDDFDIIVKHPTYSETTAQLNLNKTIDHDIKLLARFRQDLIEKLVQQNLEIEMSYKIIDNGDIGRVVDIDGGELKVQLNDKTQAVDENWKQVVAPGQVAVMYTDNDNVKLKDKVIVKDEKLCLKKDKSTLKCDVILCTL
ncbi:DUF2121 domain-containing protein [Methanobrevibacter sp.]|uniref:MJ0548 connectase family domain-containing protein n=1 Tax=Methanobrevibacter sp. TaxID=66852 RepID=UPI00388CFD27